MAEYRTPLPQLFATTLEAGVNHVLALDESSAQRLQRLEGRVLQLDVEGLGIRLYMTADSGNCRIGLDTESEADTTISGTPFALFAMTTPSDAEQWGLPGSRVHISGDANLARDMEKLFSQLDPDWEGPLASVFGDVLGFQLASGLKQGVDAIRSVARNTAEMAGSYLRDEASMLVRPAELKAFGQQVGKLQEAVERIEARLQQARKTTP